MLKLNQVVKMFVSYIIMGSIRLLLALNIIEPIVDTINLLGTSIHSSEF